MVCRTRYCGQATATGHRLLGAAVLCLDRLIGERVRILMRLFDDDVLQPRHFNVTAHAVTSSVSRGCNVRRLQGLYRQP